MEPESQSTISSVSCLDLHCLSALFPAHGMESAEKCLQIDTIILAVGAEGGGHSRPADMAALQQNAIKITSFPFNRPSRSKLSRMPDDSFAALVTPCASGFAFPFEHHSRAR